MERLIPNTNAAERLSGCSFSELFESQTLVEANGGALYGTPTFSNGGIVLNGTTDFVEYPLQEIFNNWPLSIVVKFLPHFDTDDDNITYMWDSTATARFSLIKMNNASSNVLRVRMGGSTIADIAEATYSPYWEMNKINTLVISGETGDTSVFLNGVAILSNDSSAWPIKNPVLIRIGSNIGGAGGANWFDGQVFEFKVFKSRLSLEDGISLHEKNTYQYRNGVESDLPLRSVNHDYANVRSLDISGNDNHAVLGDGSTSSTYPTKKSSRGYTFDGGDYLSLGGGPIHSDVNPYTIAILFRTGEGPDDIYSEGYTSSPNPMLRIKTDTSTSKIGVQIRNDAVATLLNTYGDNSGGDGAIHSVIWVNHAGESALYVDGIKDPTDLTYSPSGTTTLNVATVGALRRTSVSNQLIGSVFKCQRFNKVLSQLQIADWHLRAMRQINNV